MDLKKLQKKLLTLWNESKVKKLYDSVLEEMEKDKQRAIKLYEDSRNKFFDLIDTFKERTFNIKKKFRKTTGSAVTQFKSNHELEKFTYNKDDFQFMQSLSAAVLEHAPKRISFILYFWGFTLLVVTLWASFAEIDEITRGSGDVIASGDNKVIQNLEGGIVEDILVSEGDVVKANQVLIKLTNTKSSSQLLSQDVRLSELHARRIRLQAQANDIPFSSLKKTFKGEEKFLKEEEELYNLNMADLKEEDSVVKQQIIQKIHEWKETSARVEHLKKALKLIKEEVTMTAPMVREGIKSKVDFLKLKREYNDVEQKYNSSKLSLPSLSSQITEFRAKRKKLTINFKNESKKELNEVLAEIDRIKLDKNILSDQVDRTQVRSPVDGIVQKLYVKTKGGVVRPGDDIVEIVPTNDKLLLEVKIKPSDIAFLHPGAKAMVKISAYDFAIHGGLEGVITRISPDTLTDEKDGTYYLVYVKTDKSYLGSKEKPLQVIPGMLVDVDIVTGQKTIMEYILKPILKSKQYAFSER